MNVYIHLIRRLGYIGRIGLIFTAFSVGAQDAGNVLEASGVKGGLIVVLGAAPSTSSGRAIQFLADLQAAGPYVVQALETDAVKVAKARQALQDMGVYGPVSVVKWSGGALPYAENMVNLVLVASVECRVSGEEIERVLAPGGSWIIINRQSSISNPFTQPVPDGLDEWPHFLYGPGNNAVSKDEFVAPPETLRWIDGPRWSRQHDHVSSIQAMVSAGGRVYHIMDEAPVFSIGLNPDFKLTARDAFNGFVLWKQPIDDWFNHRWSNKNGPITLARRLVAHGDDVYVTMGLSAPVSRIDGRTGEILKTYEGTENTEEILFLDDTLYLVNGTTLSDINEQLASTNHYLYLEFTARKAVWEADRKNIMAVDAKKGNVRWKHEAAAAPLTLTVSDGRVFFSDWDKMVCLDAKNGETSWVSEPLEHQKGMKTGVSPVLVAHGDTVFFSGMTGQMTALNAADGKMLWQAEHPGQGYATSGDILIHDGLVWTADTVQGNKPGTLTGRDLRTGEIKNQFDPDIKIYWFHHRCHRNKGTANYLVLGRTGVEYVDVEQQHWNVNHWTRGGCMYGVMPANGLTYTAPHPCPCFLEAKLSGFTALGGRSDDINALLNPSASRMEKGFAFGKIINHQSSIINVGDWPTYRGDNARSGFAKTKVPAEVNELWNASVGENLTALTVAAGKVFFADRDAHTLMALDAESGETCWQFTAGARIDSPPTVIRVECRVSSGKKEELSQSGPSDTPKRLRGSSSRHPTPDTCLCLFGSRDGWVYALDAADGALAWKFRAAPAERQMAAFGQLESTWPVHGSVLIHDGVLYTVAGRSMFLDGGLRFIKLNPRTGEKLSEVNWNRIDPDTGGTLQDKVNLCNMPVALTDILSYDGKYLYMKEQAMDLDGHRVNVTVGNVKLQFGDETHLFAPAGFLEDTWFHRIFWVYGQNHFAIGGAHASAARHAPAGRIMCMNEDTVFSFGTEPQYHFWTTPLEYHLFACPRDFSVTESSWPDQRMTKEGPKMKQKKAPHPKFNWHRKIPILARGMVITPEALFVAGPPDVMDENEAYRNLHVPETLKAVEEQQAAWEGKRGAALYAIDPATGEELSRLELKSPPAWDGLAAADGKLYMSTMDGRVVCLGK